MDTAAGRQPSQVPGLAGSHILVTMATLNSITESLRAPTRCDSSGDHIVCEVRGVRLADWMVTPLVYDFLAYCLRTFSDVGENMFKMYSCMKFERVR